MDEPRESGPGSMLHREVLPPQSPTSGWSLIVVAATAMSFALAGSLLMVRATVRCTHGHAHPAARVLIDAPPAPHTVHLGSRVMTPPPAACGGPVYRANGDGRAEAVFELCPPRVGHIKRIVSD